MAVSGSFLDLQEWACRTARFDATDTSDLALAASAFNDAYLSTCGQGTTIPFYVTYGAAPAPSPDPAPPGASGGPAYSQQGMSWDRDCRL